MDGVDWDLEGNDKSTVNVFTRSYLDLTGSFAASACSAEYFGIMASAQSYLDVDESRFEINVTHVPVGAPSSTTVPWPQPLRIGPRLYDWFGLQLYEGWSCADYPIAFRGDASAFHIAKLVTAMEHVCTVDSGRLGRRTVHLPSSKLVLGLANG